MRFAFSAGSLRSHSVRSGVSIGPGQIAFARTPRGPNWTASDLVSAMIAPLDAVYASCGTVQPSSATKLAMLTTEPPPRFSISGIPYLHGKAVPLTLTANTRSQTFSSVSMTEWSSAGKMPALL